jgi:molybdopterin-binding protein
MAEVVVKVGDHEIVSVITRRSVEDPHSRSATR